MGHLSWKARHSSAISEHGRATPIRGPYTRCGPNSLSRGARHAIQKCNEPSAYSSYGLKMEFQNPARTLMLAESFGVLSTISVDLPGYPFGSLTPYCLDRMCRPIVYIS